MNCPRCKHDHPQGWECGAPITETKRDDVGYGGGRPTGQTRTILVDVCHCVGP